jgi:protein-disulfide isomerase
MNPCSLRGPWSARVYTIVVVFILLALPVGVAIPAPLRLTVEPGMTTGPADAPVTIVEFSDYQ